MQVYFRYLFTVLIGLGFTACSLPGTPVTPTLPLYPNMQNIIQHPLEETQVHNITFTTSDAPSTVLNFYKDVLTRQGWSILSEDLEHLTFGYETERYRGFHLSIEVVSVQSGQTLIKVTQSAIKGTDILMPAPSLNP